MSAVAKLKDDEMYYGEFGRKWLSNSDISMLMNNPTMFRKGKSDSKAMVMGRYFHWAILEPHKAESIMCIDSTTRSTKIYKEATRDGNMALLCHEKDQVDKMVDAIKGNFDSLRAYTRMVTHLRYPRLVVCLDSPGKGRRIS